jgi:MoxR-like ATPase
VQPRSVQGKKFPEGRTSDDIVLELLKIVSEPEPKKYVEEKKG